MRVVVADTSPLNYLILIGEIDVLVRLYGRIIVPIAVQRELQRKEALTLVAQWADSLPEWAEVQTLPYALTDPLLDKLGEGERAAILLAQARVQSEPILLLLDEIPARQEAARRRLAVIGTLGILNSAAEEGWLDSPTCFARLRNTNFRQPKTLMAELLAEDAERKRLQT